LIIRTKGFGKSKRTRRARITISQHPMARFLLLIYEGIDAR